MLTVPLAAIPTQTLSIVLDNQAFAMTVRTVAGSLYFSLSLGGVAVVTNKVAIDRTRLLLSSSYQGVVGDFAFVDTQVPYADPVYSGLGTRYFLIYLQAGDL